MEIKDKSSEIYALICVALTFFLAEPSVCHCMNPPKEKTQTNSESTGHHISDSKQSVFSPIANVSRIAFKTNEIKRETMNALEDCKLAAKSLNQFGLKMYPKLIRLENYRVRVEQTTAVRVGYVAVSPRVMFIE